MFGSTTLKLKTLNLVGNFTILSKYALKTYLSFDSIRSPTFYPDLYNLKNFLNP
jgi:hypothetical protein